MGQNFFTDHLELEINRILIYSQRFFFKDVKNKCDHNDLKCLLILQALQRFSPCLQDSLGAKRGQYFTVFFLAANLWILQDQLQLEL